MSPTLRRPTFEVAAFLLPFLRAPVSPPRSSLRPSRARHPRSAHPSCPQCRSLHLYKTARAVTVLGMHKVLPFDLYLVPEPSESDHKINLWKENGAEGAELVAENVSLKKAYTDYIKPGVMLYLKDDIKKSICEELKSLKGNDIPATYNNYVLLPAHTNTIKIKAQNRILPTSEFRHLALLREIHINLASPAAYWQISLDRAYQFIENGHPVEFDIRFKGSREKDHQQRLVAGPRDLWPWMHNHFPHLRPDFILKAMPEGTIFHVRPVSDGKHVKWVMAPPHVKVKSSNHFGDLTRRLFKIKEELKKSIAEGKQSELPKQMRRNLANQGHDSYSVTTGMAKGWMTDSAERWPPGVQTEEDETQRELIGPDSADRYMGHRPEKSRRALSKTPWLTRRKP
ncbi:hypothetical protein BDV95DRAFT_586167 [Massariosphaeria phaeospora]|uniref:Uncharacterized protein n=1 Tax=Massariosphaeria phaeospora TaxID=100035 RepID=A0A7C8I1L3_9PLEO|nr:hypothetical protein BDV95DRAFT_586167 [Massariosphaeria phaeospora]